MSGRSLGDVRVRRRLTISYGRRIDQVAVFIQPGDRVVTQMRCVGRLVGRIPNDFFDRGVPACKSVGVFIRFRLCRIIGFHDIIRCRTVVVRGCFLQHGRPVFVHEGHGVLIHCAVVGRGVGRVFGHFRNRRTPARKGVGILIRFRPGRVSRLHNVCRCRSVVVRGCFLQDCRSVFVHEGHVILIHCAAVGRLVGRVPGDFCDFGTPARKGVGVFIRFRLGQISRLRNLCRCRAVVVLRRADCCTVFVREGYRILPFCSVEGRGVGRVFGHFRNRRTPARKGVGVFIRRSLGRIHRLLNICRCRAVVVFRRAGFCPVFVHEGYRILPFCSGIGCLVGRVPGHFRDRGAPARKGIGILGSRSLGRISRLYNVCRCRAVVVFRRADFCTVFVHEGHCVLVNCAVTGRGVGRLIGCVPGDLRDRRAPAREGVGIFIRSRLGRIIRLHNLFRCRAVVIIHRADFRPVVVHEGHGVPVDCVVVSRGVGRVPGDFCDRGAPARKGVGIMSGRSLGRISRLHNLVRFRAVGVFRRADFCTVFVHEGYRMILIPLGDRIYIVFRNDGRGFDLLSLASLLSFFSFFCIIHEPGPGTGHAFLLDRIIPGNHASGFQCVAGKQYEMVTFFIIEGDRAGFRLRT